MKYPAQSDLWRLSEATRSRPVISDSRKSKVLGNFRQIFPLAMFPGELVVEELRIVYIERTGPWSNNVISIMATDIACVYAQCGPFFGHIHIQSLTGGPEIKVEHLFKSDTFRIRSLVEGIALAAREGLKIEASSLEAEKRSLLQAGSVI